MKITKILLTYNKELIIQQNQRNDAVLTTNVLCHPLGSSVIMTK